MKRIGSLLLSAALLLGLLAGCRQEPAAGTEPPEGSVGPAVTEPPAEPEGPAALDLVNAVFPNCGFDKGSGDVEYLIADEDGAEFLSAYLENAYSLQNPWKDAAVIRGMGASAFELAVLRMEDESAAARAANALGDYRFARMGDFAGYAPEQADLAGRGQVCQVDEFVGLFICPDTAAAEKAFRQALSGEGGTAPVDDSIDALMERMLDTCASFGDDVSDLERINSGETDRLNAVIQGEYGLDDGGWEEAAIARGKDGSAFELALLQIRDDRVRTVAISQLSRYLDAREEAYARFPAQAKLLYQADAWTPMGTNYVILVVGADPQGTASALGEDLTGGGAQALWSSGRHFEDDPSPGYEPDPAYPDRAEFNPPNEEDMSLYDTAAIRAAWEKGDPAGLSDYDKDIYSAAEKVLDKLLKGGMGALEKETAIYEWIVNEVDYDWTHQDVMAETPRESYTPYGGLVDQRAVCLGYAATFQLLCDLAGVECITVVGATFSGSGDHAWNMVRLDGNWYCVDVTWDANYREQGTSSGREKDWDYFNLTSDEMAKGHQWDYANTPEAVTQGKGRG